MKRRGFLTMLGGVIAAPAIPMAAPAGYSSTAYKIAMAHAKKFPVISVAGMSRRCDLSATQAEALIKELAVQGKVKLVGPSVNGKVRAASKIYTKDAWGIARTAEPRDAQREARRSKYEAGEQAKPVEAETPQLNKAAQVDVAPWLAHLHDLCRAQGMTLSPRCFA